MHPHSSVHELNSVSFACLENLIEFRDIESDGLLEEQVLLLLRRQHRPPDVEAGGEGDVDGVHVGVVEDGVVAAVDLGGGREAICGGEFRGFVDGAAADGVEGGVGGQNDGP